MADNATLARTFYEAYNERNFDKAAQLMAQDGEILVVGTGEKRTGPEGVLDYDSAWADGFPDSKVTIDRLVTAGDYVFVEFTGQGTHTGELRSAMGNIPATGRSVTLQLCDVYEFKDGKAKSLHVYFDSGSMMAQLGLTAGQTASTQR